MSSLAAPFFALEPLPASTRQEFVQELWPQRSTTQKESLIDFDSYFKFMQQERDPELAHCHAVETLQDVLFIISYIRTHQTATFADASSQIQSRKPNSSLLEVSRSIELAVRLWLMLNVRNLMPTDLYQLETSIPWPDEHSIKSVLEQQFTPRPSGISAMFPEYLNASDMGKIAGFRIEWTNSLSSHLTIKGSVIYVFHNVSALRRMRESLADSGFVCLIPPTGSPR